MCFDQGESISIVQAASLGELLNEVQYRGDSVVITKGGKPVAALVDIALFENIRRMREDFDRMCAQLAEVGKNMTESEVEVLVAEAVAEVWSEVRAARAQRRADSNQSGGK